METSLLWERKAVYIEFESGKRTIVEGEEATAYPFNPCSLKIYHGDLIIRAIDIPVCTCACDINVGVGSYNVFFLTREDISAIDFSPTFDALFESRFKMIDLRYYYKGVQGCFMPFAEYDRESERPHSLIISTLKRTWALVFIDHIDINPRTDCGPAEFHAINKLRIDWYLQTDGSMDFSQVTSVKNTKTPKLSSNSQGFKIRFANQLFGKTGEFYSINGKRIEKIKSHSPYGLVICKEPVIK